MTTPIPTTLSGLANYAPRTATVSAVQFTGQLDPGTGRWGDAHDNWTFGSDGTDYPGSYGIGPDGLVRSTGGATPAMAAAPTEPVAEAVTPTESTSPEGDILN